MLMVKLNRAPRHHLLACPDIYGELQGRQIFTDPPAMRGTSGQVYTEDMIIHSLEIIKICAICVQKYSCSTILLR